MICEKITYENYSKAVEALKSISSLQRQKMKAYKCQHCGNYHLATIRVQQRKVPKDKYRKSQTDIAQLRASERVHYDISPMPKRSTGIAVPLSTFKISSLIKSIT